MECCEGSLENIIKKGPMVDTAIVDFAQQMITVSAYLYEKEIIHRDIKPANILTKENGFSQYGVQYKLCDFGKVQILKKNQNVLSGKPLSLLANFILGKRSCKYPSKHGHQQLSYR